MKYIGLSTVRCASKQIEIIFCSSHSWFALFQDMRKGKIEEGVVRVFMLQLSFFHLSFFPFFVQEAIYHLTWK